MTTLLQQANAWLAQDPDSETRAELQTLIDNAQTAAGEDALAARFASRLAFGTAGLRGKLQAGPNGMNRVVVAQTAAGFARYLLANYKSPSIVIGYDGRKNSRRFAEDTAEIMTGAGIDAMLLPECLPTPVLAFAVRALDASAGVMVTASHNPPQDNGYKVYLGGADGGSQIVAPADSDIATEINYVAEHLDIRDLSRSDSYTVLGDDIAAAYVAKTAALRQAPIAPLNYVYTAMHGVGCKTFLATLAKADLPQPHLVAAQCTPDARFPTVNFPNPEEPGALDLAYQEAEKQQAEFIIANDPDADRLAVAVKIDGKWQRLHGNTIGLWFAWHLAQKAQAAGIKGTLANSLVSSPLLAKIAAQTGMDYQETLTGFKWISRVPKLIFGYEEALGYLVDPDKVHDKDGISAAIYFLDLVLSLRAEGKTLADYAREFNATFGANASGQVSLRVSDITLITKIMQRIRKQPFADIASFPVAGITDHLQTDKHSNILVYHLEDGQRVIFRPSGTEPKLKVYIDTIGGDETTAQQSLTVIKNVLQNFLKDYS